MIIDLIKIKNKRIKYIKYKINIMIYNGINLLNNFGNKIYKNYNKIIIILILINQMII